MDLSVAGDVSAVAAVLCLTWRLCGGVCFTCSFESADLSECLLELRGAGLETLYTRGGIVQIQKSILHILMLVTRSVIPSRKFSEEPRCGTDGVSR